jgi:phage shock protein A
LPKLAEVLERVRSEIADVVQSRERVQESMTPLLRAQAKLGQQAETARRLGREDLALVALARQESVRSQVAALGLQYDELLAEEARLEAKLTITARALRAKVDALSQPSE